MMATAWFQRALRWVLRAQKPSWRIRLTVPRRTLHKGGSDNGNRNE